MKSTTICALFCTIIVVLTINSNEAAPVKKVEPTAVIKPAPGVIKPEEEKPTIITPKLTGTRGKWSKKIDGDAKKLFNDYKKHIVKKLQQTHKLPVTFVPKPDQHAKQLVAGVLHHYLVKVPGDKYAYVTVGHRSWEKGNYGKPENVNVRPQLYALTDKNI